MTCLAAKDIDCRYASKLAFMLECMVLDSQGHWNAACKLLDEYKSEWEQINPSPPIFMGESTWSCATMIEREACAQIVEQNAQICANNSMLQDVLNGNAAAIRARSNTNDTTRQA